MKLFLKARKQQVEVVYGDSSRNYFIAIDRIIKMYSVEDYIFVQLDCFDSIKEFYLVSDKIYKLYEMFAEMKEETKDGGQ